MRSSHIQLYEDARTEFMADGGAQPGKMHQGKDLERCINAIKRVFNYSHVARLNLVSE
jgi:hypothetical protein